ncbi:MAG: VOC family protein [Elusimicrobiota bacterium]
MFIKIFIASVLCLTAFSFGTDQVLKKEIMMKQTAMGVEIKKLSPVLLATDVAVTIKFYEEVLNFKRTMTAPEKEPFAYGIVENGGVEVQFGDSASFAQTIKPPENGKPGGTFALYMDIANIDELYARAVKRAKIVKELHDTPYGTREFYMLDLNGYLLGFAEKR